MWQSVIVETKDQMMPPPSPQLLNSAASPPERIVGQWTYCGGGESTYIPPHNLYLPLLTILPNRSVMRGVLFTLQTRESTVSYFPIFNLGCGKKTMKQEILRRTLPVGLSVLFPLRHKMTKVPGPPCHIRYQTKIAIYCPQGSGTLHQQLTILHYLALFYIILHYLAPSFTILHHLALFCSILHYLALSCTILQ